MMRKKAPNNLVSTLCIYSAIYLDIHRLLANKNTYLMEYNVTYICI
jgi:hypothetical protein